MADHQYFNSYHAKPVYIRVYKGPPQILNPYIYGLHLVQSHSKIRDQVIPVSIDLCRQLTTQNDRPVEYITALQFQHDEVNIHGIANYNASDCVLLGHVCNQSWRPSSYCTVQYLLQYKYSKHRIQFE